MRGCCSLVATALLCTASANFWPLPPAGPPDFLSNRQFVGSIPGASGSVGPNGICGSLAFVGSACLFTPRSTPAPFQATTISGTVIRLTTTTVEPEPSLGSYSSSSTSRSSTSTTTATVVPASTSRSGLATSTATATATRQSTNTAPRCSIKEAVGMAGIAAGGLAILFR